MDVRMVQVAASSIISSRPRVFEISWDSSKESFDLCFGAQTKDDLDHMIGSYRQHIKIGTVDSTFVDIGTSGGSNAWPAPRWLSKVDPSRCRFFFVSNAFGHHFALFDVKRTGRLMTPLLLALQRSEYAWVQFEWFEHPLQRYLSDLGQRMRDRFVRIDAPIQKFRTWEDEKGKVHRERYTVDHPAKFGEFHTTYKRLAAHLTGKQGRTVVTIVRGMVQDYDQGTKAGLPFGQIEDSDEVRQPHDLSFGQVSTQVGESKIGERLQERWTNDPRMIYDLVTRRVFDVDKRMKHYVKSYLRHLEGLPHLILSADELGLLVHLPSSDIGGVKTTRQGGLPRAPTRPEREGIQLTQ
jgi:hypothetical protein